LDDVEFMADIKAARLHDAHPIAGLTLWALLLVIAVGLVWANWAELEEVTRGTGKVIPSSREQVIQSLEGGILAELSVRAGDTVEKGQMLLRIDDIRFSTSAREARARTDAMRAAVVRLKAEIGERGLSFPEDLRSNHPDLVRSESELYQSNRRAIDQAVAAQRRTLALTEEELRLTEPLVGKGAASEVEVIRLRRQVNELRGQINERLDRYRAQAQQEMTKIEADLRASAEILTQREDQVRRTVVRAPLRGTVKNIRVTTLGGVIQPGSDIMEIVPLEDQLLIEARILPSDVAFLHPGLTAKVKITAYDYSVYGSLDGVLEQISPDTINNPQNPDESFYRVTVRTKQSSLQGAQGALPIIPGMTAAVEVITGKKSVLEYLLNPLIKARESALRER
jgi:adhesin transport system membrane fusion protein